MGPFAAASGLAVAVDFPGSIGFTTEQKLWLAAAWVVFFLVPAFFVRAHAKRHGHEWGRWFFLTLVGSILGPLEYWEHIAVSKRRAERAARKKAAEEPAAAREAER